MRRVWKAKGRRVRLEGGGALLSGRVGEGGGNGGASAMGGDWRGVLGLRECLIVGYGVDRVVAGRPMELRALGCFCCLR